VRGPASRHRSSRRFALLLALGVVVVLALSLVFNRNGLIAISDLKGSIDMTQRSIDTLSRRVDSLRTETDGLQSDSEYIEKAVREVLGWGRPDEFVIRIVSDGPEGTR